MQSCRTGNTEPHCAAQRHWPGRQLVRNVSVAHLHDDRCVSRPESIQSPPRPVRHAGITSESGHSQHRTSEQAAAPYPNPLPVKVQATGRGGARQIAAGGRGQTRNRSPPRDVAATRRLARSRCTISARPIAPSTRSLTHAGGMSSTCRVRHRRTSSSFGKETGQRIECAAVALIERGEHPLEHFALPVRCSMGTGT